MSDWQTKRLSQRIGGGKRFGHNAEDSHSLKEDPAVVLTEDAVKLQKRNTILGDSGWTMVGSGIQEWKIPSVSEKKYASFEATYGIEYLVNTSASVVVTLPPAKVNGVVVIKDYLGQAVVNPIQVKARGSETIDGYTSKWINADYWSLTLVSDGSNWFMKNQVDGTMLNQVTLVHDQTGGVALDWSIGDTYKIAVNASGLASGITVTHSNVADKVIILAIHNTSSTTALSVTLPAAIGNSSLSSTTMPVTVDAASWSIFTWFNLNSGTAGSGNLFVSGVENLS